jgi:hypothetical protein
MDLGRALLPLLVSPMVLFGQYRAELTGPPRDELARSIAQVLSPSGFKISGDGAPYCEIWFRSSAPAHAASSEHGVTLPSVAFGALVGVIHFDGEGLDRRGQRIQPGWYTLRYGIMPANQAHEGASPQRDFLLLTPAAADRDPASTPDFDHLVAMSKQASGTPHPAVLSFWKAASDAPGFSRQGDDWVLETRLGGLPIAVILIGTINS